MNGSAIQQRALGHDGRDVGRGQHHDARIEVQPQQQRALDLGPDLAGRLAGCREQHVAAVEHGAHIDVAEVRE
jgi:hypothetical protein